jgi:hypothetical protein
MPNIPVDSSRSGILFALRRWMLLRILLVTIAPASVHIANAFDPLVSATLNGSSTPLLFRGRPGIFEIELMHPDLWETTLQPILIEQAGGISWANSLKPSVLNESGAIAPWPLWMRPVTAKTLTLDGEHIGKVFFLLSPEETTAFIDGVYSVEFVLDTRPGAVAGSWFGVTRSVRMDVRVQAAPAILTPVQLARRQILLGQYHALRNDLIAAGAAVNALLLTQPRNLGGLRAKAMILEAGGDFIQALSVTDEALRIFDLENSNPPEPPRDLLKLRAELTEKAPITSLRIASAMILNGQVSITWAGDVGTQYTLQSSADIRAWAAAATGLQAVNGTVVWSGAVTTGVRFFRIIVE